MAEHKFPLPFTSTTLGIGPDLGDSSDQIQSVTGVMERFTQGCEVTVDRRLPNRLPRPNTCMHVDFESINHGRVNLSQLRVGQFRKFEQTVKTLDVETTCLYVIVMVGSDQLKEVFAKLAQRNGFGCGFLEPIRLPDYLQPAGLADLFGPPPVSDPRAELMAFAVMLKLAPPYLGTAPVEPH